MLSDYECVDGSVECSTLTPEQAAGLFRYAGIKTSAETIRDGIEQGVFPFAVFIGLNKRTFIISRVKCVSWLEEFTGVKVPVDEILAQLAAWEEERKQRTLKYKYNS